MLDTLINYRQKGFDRFEQEDDEAENQLLKSDEEDEITSSNGSNGKVNIQIKSKSTKFHNKNNAAALRLGDNL